MRADAEQRVIAWQEGLAKAKLLEADLSKLEVWLTEASKVTDKEQKVADVPLDKLQASLVKLQVGGTTQWGVYIFICFSNLYNLIATR